jgi:hypothetical protein
VNTRGIILAASSYGIVTGFRIYKAEELLQVGLFYFDSIDNYSGNL